MHLFTIESDSALTFLILVTLTHLNLPSHPNCTVLTKDLILAAKAETEEEETEVAVEAVADSKARTTPGEGEEEEEAEVELAAATAEEEDMAVTAVVVGLAAEQAPVLPHLVA